MSSDRRSQAILVLALLLLSALCATGSAPIASADCEEELEAVRGELNATKEELAEVEKERDDYAQRLEDSTTIMILSLILLVGSYFVFYLNTRRAKIALLEYQKKMGIDPRTRPRKRRRG